MVEYVRLGATGLEVSRLCLGSYSFGEPIGRSAWGISEDVCRSLVRTAVEAGVNFFDSANVYSRGDSERILGRAIAEFADRAQVVIGTKVHTPMRKGPNAGGLSRKAVLHEIDASLERLGVDYVDLYQIHRWDPITPIEETMEALHDVVKSGKARYLGASSMAAWQFAKAQHAAERHGWTRFISMQDHYNLLYREEEREMIPMCIDQGVGVIPWSPLARGVLAREWAVRTARTDGDPWVDSLYEDASPAVVDAVGKVASDRRASRAQVALAWVATRRGVVAPVVGATRVEHLAEALAAMALRLDDDEVAQLEAPYLPRRHEVW